MVRCPNCGEKVSGEECPVCKYPLPTRIRTGEERSILDEVTIKPTWQLAWGLFWRIFLISIGVYAIIFGILFVVFGAVLFAFLENVPW